MPTTKKADIDLNTGARQPLCTQPLLALMFVDHLIVQKRMLHSAGYICLGSPEAYASFFPLRSNVSIPQPADLQPVV